jgi:hypothetical protein
VLATLHVKSVEQPCVQTEALEQRAREVFIAILRRFNKQVREVSPKIQSNNGAPHVFAGETEAKDLHKSPKVRKKLLRDAMSFLFSANQIYVARPKGKRYECLYAQGTLL